jgi:phage terminase Nu1 subunit (DNA packaging protein)
VAAAGDRRGERPQEDGSVVNRATPAFFSRHFTHFCNRRFDIITHDIRNADNVALMYASLLIETLSGEG